MSNKFVMVLIVLLLAVSMVFATQPKDVLQARYDKMNCYAQIALDYAEAMKTTGKIDQDSLIIDKINEIKASKSLLSSFIKSSDKNALFDLEMNNIYDKITSLNGKVEKKIDDYSRDDVDTVYKNLKSKLSSFKKELTTCLKAPQISIIQLRINAYNKDISSWNSKISFYKKQGIDTNEMSSIVSKANKQIIVPLGVARDSLDYNKMQIALGKYCLYDGCDSNNFHFTEQMEIARFSAILTKLQNDVFSSQLPIQWVNASNALNLAEVNLLKTSGNKFDANVKQDLYNNLRVCSDNLVSIYTVLGSVKK